jgi:hypothetical protein
VVFDCDMACFKPIEAWYSKEVNPSGKRSLVFTAKYGEDPDRPIEIACGQCIGCRLERSRQWALRCMHEASLYEDNCFLTLTFNDESLSNREFPESLDVRDFQLFMKRLRKRFGDGIRFFHCGEYGEKYSRPHYHACIFNFDFPDKELWRVDPKTGVRLYRSRELEKLWPYGYSSIGDVTFESAAYVARYITKKQTGQDSEKHYIVVDEETGELVGYRKPEYITMSRRPGIGKEWFDKFKTDVYPSDSIHVNGKKFRPPKYYDKLFQDSNPYEFDEIKEKRLADGMTYKLKEFGSAGIFEVRARLDAKLKCQERAFSYLPRKLEREI